MKTIAISLQKGGTGKTSLAVSLAAELACSGEKTILIDLDPQGSASAWIGSENLTAEVAGVLLKETPLENALIKTAFPELSILPTAGLGGELKLFSETKALQQPFCLRNLVKTLEEYGYKYCILDLSPAIGALERAALIAADEVITPVMPDVFGLDGLQIFASNLVAIREDMDTHKPTYKRIVVNAIDWRIQQHSKILNKIREMGTAFSIYTIPVDQVFRKAQAAGVTIQALGKGKKETLTELTRITTELTRITTDIIEEGAKHGK